MAVQSEEAEPALAMMVWLETVGLAGVMAGLVGVAAGGGGGMVWAANGQVPLIEMTGAPRSSCIAKPSSPLALKMLPHERRNQRVGVMAWEMFVMLEQSFTSQVAKVRPRLPGGVKAKMTEAEAQAPKAGMVQTPPAG